MKSLRHISLGCLTLLMIASCGSSDNGDSSTNVSSDVTTATDFVRAAIDWRPQDYYNSQGVTDITYNSGQANLVLSCNLKGQDEQLSSGEIVLDLKYVPTVESHVPIDMTNRTITVEVEVPSGFIGPSSSPSGMQLVVKDGNDLSQYGTWTNITSSGNVTLAFTPSTTTPVDGATDAGFDPTKIRTIGLKLGINSTSTHEFIGEVHVHSLEVYPVLPSTPLPEMPAETPASFVNNTSEISLEADGFYSGGKKWFVVGGNWRLIEYGQNFGTTAWFPNGNGVSLHRGYISAKLKLFRAAGVTLIRVGLLDDGRTMFDIDGNVVGYNARFREDVATLLDLAAANDMKVEFVLNDFLIAGKAEEVDGVWVRGRREVLEDASKRTQFIANFLEPFLTEFGSHSALFGFDLMNEPEWIISSREGGGWEDVTDASKDASPVSLVDIHSYFNACIDSIRQLASGKFITVGLSIKFMDIVQDLDLDYLALHYYPWMGDLDSLISSIPDSDIWLFEEYPGTGDVTSYLTTVYHAGGHGALLWNLSPEIDDQSYQFDEEESKLLEVRRFVDETDGSNISIELLSPADGATLPSGAVTFKWKVENAGVNFTSKLLLDKGVNPYDGWIETSYTIPNGVTVYTKSFSASWWGCFDWGIEVNGYTADKYFDLCISDK